MKPRLRLAIVTPRLVRGDGQGRVNYEIVRHVLEIGGHVTVVASAIDPDLERDPSVRFVRRGMPRLPTSFVRSQIFSLQSACWLLKHRDDFDLLHSNGSVTLAASDVNAAHFVHGAWAKSPAHTSRYYHDAYGLYHYILTAFHAFQERIAFARARHVVAISHQVKRDLVTIGVAEDKISVIHNGVDIDEFRPAAVDRRALGVPTNGFVALFVGDMTVPRKNLDIVLEALRELPFLHVVAVGGLQKNPYPAKAAALGVADRVTFLGFRRDIGALMNAADVFVYPSRYEPLGLVVLEALAAGLPIITAATTGAAELIDESCGIVLEHPDDLVGLCESLQRLAFDPGLRDRMGFAARDRATTLTWRAMTERYVELYATVSEIGVRDLSALGSPSPIK